MKNIRKLLVFILFLMIFVGCASPNGEIFENNNNNEKIKLDVTQADLIASITDNEKYLNKDLLYSLDTLEDSDNVSVIITLNENGFVDSYNNNSNGYSSLGEFVNSKGNQSTLKSMIDEQEETINKLKSLNYINEVNHSYTTLFNGFSAKTTYGQFKKLIKSGLDIKVTLSEAYSKPATQTLDSNSSYEAVTNYVDVYETGIFNSSGVKYDGNNTAVAILDSGFDIHHTVFQNMPDEPMISREEVQEVLYETKAYSYFNDIKVQDVYMNSKIPFVYDYADKDSDVAPYDSNHGTHVAGIIGGSDDVITGVAVNTQLVLMKVFGDINNGALQEDILAALEDAMLLGVDAINLSLGSACGFARSTDEEYINVVYDKIEASGISLVVAASNDYSSGYGGENSNTNKASNPDSATVGSPGSYKSTISVASISGVKSKYIVTEDGYTFFFNNANNSAGEPYDFYDMLFQSLGTIKNRVEIEYVTVPGVGKKVNYSSVNVEGKIALVKRGDISFEEKAQIALSQGAIGCIIYNNIAGDVFMNAGSKLELAFCSISKDDGEYLAAKGSGKLVFDKTYLAGPFMSEFSSWGPVSDLSLKPEITAHGGSILSAVPGGGYEKISGTSMACPNLCGVIILVRQALKERYPDMNAVEITNLANSLFMSTGTIILDEQGNPYSPRKQGAGLGNLQYALDTLAYLSVEGSTKPKLELKDDPNETGVYELIFDVNNLSNTKLQYRLSNFTMTETLSTADPEYVAEKGYMLSPDTEVECVGDGNIDGDVITVNENGTVTIKYTIKLTEKEKAYIRKSFINGMYVEGFAVLNSMNEDNIDLSLPFLAFFGDWTQAPIFDKTFYEVESEAHSGAINEEDKIKADYYATTPLGTYYYSYIIPLGSYVYEMDESKYDPIPATEEHAAIGYNLNTINGITTVYAGLLRNAKKMTTTIKNSETGETVYEHIKYDEHKAYFSGSIVPGYDIINVTAMELGLQNNTNYTFTMQAELDYGDGGLKNNLNNQFEFSFYVDYESPIITDAQFYTKYDKSLKDNRYYVDVYVYDNHYAQSIRPFTIIDGELVSLSENVIPIYGEKGTVNKVTVEITDYMDLFQYGVLEDEEFPLTNGLGFLVDDYALNQSYSYVTLPGTNSSNITFKEGYYSSSNNGVYQFHKDIYTGDTLDLSNMLTSDDELLVSDEEIQAEYFSKLKWTSSDEKVIKVKNGKIEAVGKGTAVITCTTMKADGYVYNVSLKIRVREGKKVETSQKLEDIKLTYFDTLKAFVDGPDMSEIGETGDRIFFTEKSEISCYPSEQVKLGFELEPWNLKDYKLIFSSTNEKVATVDENGVVTALKEGNATITLKVEVDGRVSSLMSSVKVIVKNEFVIEGNTLVAYKGLGGNVVIPDDEGILYIGSFAFSLYTTDYEIKIEEDDYDAAKTPASNNSVVSVTIPSDVKEVQKYAFYNCTALETVKFLVDEKGVSCPMIREYAFYGDTSLVNINLEEIDLIGAYAFGKCSSLVNINLKSAYAIGEHAFVGCVNIAYADITALRNAGVGVFEGCENLKTIDNGIFTNFSEKMFKDSGLTSLTFKADRIPNNCFENCNSLKEVVIENKVVYVGEYAFNNCHNLEEVKFNNNASSEFIYKGAFNNCESLKSITLPDSNFVFEGNVFDNCSCLETIYFNKNTYIENITGGIFNNCNSLSNFVVNESNSNYKVKDNHLLLSKDETKIIIAAKNYEYGNYFIPSTILVIGDSAFNCIDSLTSLTIHSNVNEIGVSAFENCSNLQSVKLENVNTVIKDKAFRNCENLQTFNNLQNLTVINPFVFENTGFITITLNSEIIGTGAFKNMKLLTEVNINSAVINDYAFSDNLKLTKAVINCNEIGDYAFNNCSSLSNIALNNVVSIGEGAFYKTGIIELNSNTTETIGDYAFYNCSKLASVILSNVKNIRSYAFSADSDTYLSNLKTVEFTDSLVSVGEYAFYAQQGLESVKIGNGIKEFGVYSFGECAKLTSFTASGNVDVISEAMFYNDTLLSEVVLPNVKYVNAVAFMNCSSLKEIDLSNVLEIGLQSFEKCTSLEKVDLDKCLIIGDGAFLSCTNLKEVNMKCVEKIGMQSLSCIGITELKLPFTLTYIAPTAFNYNQLFTKFTDVFGKDNGFINDYILLDEGVLYTVTDNNKYLLSCYPTAKENTSYNVLFNTTRIEEYAGYFNQNLQSIVFPDTLELVGNMCFYGCIRLETVEFKSTTAPILEGTVTLNIEYDQNTEIFKLLNKYFQFNGYYPLYYGQFNDMVGKSPKMNIVLPANSDVKGYDSIIYSLYFDLENKVISDYEALNDYSIDYLNKVSLIKDEVTLADGDIIVNARTAYNLLNQDLTKYGYEEEYLNSLLLKLETAENAWKELNNARINKVYGFLIGDIEELGSVYDFNKISKYYSILESLEIINRDDKKYIDTTNVDEFKKGFDQYFKDLNDDVNTLTEVSSLPTTNVNKVGLTVLAAVSSSLGLSVLLILVLKKRLFI